MFSGPAVHAPGVAMAHINVLALLALPGLISGGAAAAGPKVDTTVLDSRIWQQRKSAHSRRVGSGRLRSPQGWCWCVAPCRDHGSRDVRW
jgi:hypothetical protein